MEGATSTTPHGMPLTIAHILNSILKPSQRSLPPEQPLTLAYILNRLLTPSQQPLSTEQPAMKPNRKSRTSKAPDFL